MGSGRVGLGWGRAGGVGGAKGLETAPKERLGTEDRRRRGPQRRPSPRPTLSEKSGRLSVHTHRHRHTRTLSQRIFLQPIQGAFTQTDLPPPLTNWQRVGRGLVGCLGLFYFIGMGCYLLLVLISYHLLLLLRFFILLFSFLFSCFAFVCVVSLGHLSSLLRGGKGGKGWALISEIFFWNRLSEQAFGLSLPPPPQKSKK